MASSYKIVNARTRPRNYFSFIFMLLAHYHSLTIHGGQRIKDEEKESSLAPTLWPRLTFP